MLTYTDLTKGFEFGPWTVLPERDLIRDGEEERHIEPIVMNVFVVLASHGGGVVTRNQLIDAVWDGRPQSDEVITRCISALRRSLGDDAKTPQYIETLQKRGYRVMKRVRLPDATEPHKGRTLTLRPLHLLVLAAAVVALLALGRSLIEGTSPAVRISSVAVYPFECKQAAANSSEHLCFGFAEEVISALKRISDLKVIRMRRPYSGTAPENVQGIVTGSVQIIGNEVRIAAFLEDARSGRTICCDTLHATQRTIFDNQKLVARAVSLAINANGQDSAAEPTKPASFEAEEAYSAGRYLFEKRDHDSVIDAIEEFRKAIELEDKYGAAWLGLGYTYVNWPDYDRSASVNREDMYREALQVIEQGVTAVPGIRDAAGTVYGFVYLKRNQWAAAEEAFNTAIGAEIEQAIAYHWYSYFLAGIGRLDAALEQALNALLLDPDNLSTISRVAILALYNNDLNTAERYFDKANLLGLDNYAHSFMYSLLLYRQGRIIEAKDSGKRGVALISDVDASWFDLIVDGSLQPELRQQAVETLDQISAKNVLPANAEMFFWMLLDEVDRALTIARRLEQEDGLYETELLFTDEFRVMRQHPDFEELVTAIGLSEYWASAGCNWSGDNVRCR
jgi:DNA-binding winged helix-turn-helix (wHTH) protein/TolB-like protein/Flp pilus assembly protein TadD